MKPAPNLVSGDDQLHFHVPVVGAGGPAERAVGESSGFKLGKRAADGPRRGCEPCHGAFDVPPAVEWQSCDSIVPRLRTIRARAAHMLPDAGSEIFPRGVQTLHPRRQVVDAVLQHA